MVAPMAMHKFQFRDKNHLVTVSLEGEMVAIIFDVHPAQVGTPLSRVVVPKEFWDAWVSHMAALHLGYKIAAQLKKVELD